MLKLYSSHSTGFKSLKPPPTLHYYYSTTCAIIHSDVSNEQWVADPSHSSHGDIDQSTTWSIPLQTTSTQVSFRFSS